MPMIYDECSKDSELVIVESYIEYWESNGYRLINDGHESHNQ